MPKIIVLYILKQVTKTIFFTFLILFGILFFNESIQFLEKASRGDLYPSLLIPVLFYSLPATLEVSIPISVFLGILISIYNLNKTNELSFIYQLGMGQKNLTLVTLIPVIFCSFFVFFNSFYFVPQSNENLSFLSDSQSFSDKFKLMGEGKINAFPDLGGIIFAKEASDRGFKDVFANFNSENSDLILNSKEVLGSSQDEKLNKLTFESGNLVIPSQSGTIDLEFEELFFLFNKKQKLAEKNIEKMSLSLLIQEDKNEDFYTEFLKRLSLSLMLIISSLLAIPLSLRMAKKGRFTMILSGLVIFLTYYGLVQGQKALVLESSFSSFQVFSVLHFIFVAIWLLLYGLEQYRFELVNFIIARNSKNFFIQAFFLTALVFFLLNILYFNF